MNPESSHKSSTKLKFIPVLMGIALFTFAIEISNLRHQLYQLTSEDVSTEDLIAPRIPFEATFENSIEFCYRGKVVNVIDGDTIDVQLNRGFDDFTVKRFRLSGINAPEMKDVPKGEEAKNTLSSMILNKPVIVKTKKDQTDRYGRFLGTIYLYEGQINVNEQMVKIGKATIY